MTHSYGWHDSFIHMQENLPSRSFPGPQTISLSRRNKLRWNVNFQSSFFHFFLPPVFFPHSMTETSRCPSCVWMRHITHIHESYHTYTWVMSPRMNHDKRQLKIVSVWTSRVTRMSASCHTYAQVKSHVWISQVTHMNASCDEYEWTMSHIWTNHVTHINESCHTYKWVKAHTWMRPIRVKHTCIIHVTHMNKLCGKSISATSESRRNKPRLFVCISFENDYYKSWFFWGGEEQATGYWEITKAITLQVCVCVCVCACFCVCVYIGVCVRVYFYVYVYLYVCLCLWICVFEREFVCAYVCVRALVYVCVYVCVYHFPGVRERKRERTAYTHTTHENGVYTFTARKYVCVCVRVCACVCVRVLIYREGRREALHDNSCHTHDCVQYQ